MSIYRGPGGAGDATNDATSQAILAKESALAAAASQAAAAGSASSAATSATNAASSATSAANSATTATTEASNAATSATNAANSAATATTKASEASTSATNAAASESAAASSATAAASSATSASNSATTATTKASEASTSATSAATSATNAAASAVDAQSSEDAAAAYAASINPANFLTKANNLSDLTNTSTARTNLGVAIGTNVQAYSSELQAISNGGGNVMFKNRIINGAMMIDQRNAGASVTPTGSGTYTLDRWVAYISQPSKFSVQQNAGSVLPPAGFTNYLGVTSLSAYSVSSTDYFLIGTRIEGFNFADLRWGTTDAQPITLSFRVCSSLTGTFGGVLANSGDARTYPFSYTISSANTWTTITITVSGDTSGTWITNNGVGLTVCFGLGVGSTYSGTAGSWVSAPSYAYSPTGATSVVGTNGATFYITGVQLEKGSTFTSFDYRLYGTELALCQRYYFKYAGAGIDFQDVLNRYSTTGGLVNVSVPVSMRTSPTVHTTATTYGRGVFYDTSFGVSVQNITSLAVTVNSSSSNSNILLVMSHASVAGTYMMASFDTGGGTTDIGLSAEL